MITHERLKELIEQGAKIWGICDYTYHKNKPNKKIEYYDLSSEDVCISPAEFRDYGLRIYNSLGYWNDVRYENLFETKEDAEWEKEFGLIGDTHYLDLPTWEKVNEIPNTKLFCIFYAYDNECDEMRKYVLDRDLDRDEIIIIMYDWGESAGDIIWSKKYTKENYILACRKSKELFLGEE